MTTSRTAPGPRLLRSRWTPGPVPFTLCPVHVSLTEFTASGHLHAGAVARDGLRLRRTWHRTPGALGLWLWADLAGRRSGAVSVWTDEVALKEFVTRPDHIEIVRAHRGRGTVRATVWTAEDFDPDATWARARTLLTDPNHWPQQPFHQEEA